MSKLYENLESVSAMEKKKGMRNVCSEDKNYNFLKKHPSRS